jgi:hypothetical protein
MHSQGDWALNYRATSGGISTVAGLRPVMNVCSMLGLENVLSFKRRIIKRNPDGFHGRVLALNENSTTKRMDFHGIACSMTSFIDNETDPSL